MSTTSERADGRQPIGPGGPSISSHDEEVGRRPIAAVMSAPVFAVPSRSNLGDVLRAMLRTGRRHVLVVDSHGRCLGMLDDRAVATAWTNDPSALDEELAGQLVKRTASVVDCQATLQNAAAVMIRDGVDAVAVVDADGLPVGVVTGGDLVALVARVCAPGPPAAKPMPRPA